MKYLVNLVCDNGESYNEDHARETCPLCVCDTEMQAIRYACTVYENLRNCMRGEELNAVYEMTFAFSQTIAQIEIKSVRDLSDCHTALSIKEYEDESIDYNYRYCAIVLERKETFVDEEYWRKHDRHNKTIIRVSEVEDYIGDIEETNPVTIREIQIY